ncbi:MAG: histidine kinase dimerization/phospho-acceptor domain-containing protein [Dokdonella sp.]
MKLKSVSLRWRMTLAFGLLGAVLSGLFAGATTFITEYYEEVLLDGMLSSFAADITARHSHQIDHPLVLPESHTLQGYLRLADGSGHVPEAYVSLPLGIHEIDRDDDLDVRVGVFQLGKDRLFLTIDLDDVEPLETDLDMILAAIVGFGTVIAAWFGWLFSGRTIAPVRRLADAVAALPAQAQPTQLALQSANDEVGRLAKAIDGYQDRLMQAEERERAFFADASHELRTPLAVVRGGAELLLDDSHVGGYSRAQLERVDRGVQTLSDLLEVLLGLARRTKNPVESVDVRNWLDQVLVGLQSTERIGVEIAPGHERLVLRPREAGLVVRGILRRLDRSRVAETIRIHVDANALTLSSVSPLAGPSEPARSQENGDIGLGATLIGRLAAQMDWMIDESNLSAGRIAIRLPVLAALNS